MTDLVFLEPATLAEANTLLAEHGGAAKLLAGGTAVVLLLQQKLIHPAALISLGRVEGLQGIAVDAEGALHVGAMASLAQVADDERVRRGWPLLAMACAVVGNVRVRNQATLGGNMAEADYASDPPAALVALDGYVRIVGPRGERQAALAEFFLGFYTTTLAEDELLIEIVVPPLPSRASSAYLKYKSRSSEDRPCVGVAAVLAVEDGACTAARVAVGAACETPQRFPALESQIVGQRLTPAMIGDFAGAYAAALPEPLNDLRGSAWYRREMTRVHVRRALSALAGLETAQ